jgi:CheY-like chemotaxis protein
MAEGARTVLVVEDNEVNRAIYIAALRFAKYRVLEAESGREGLELAREHVPDLILMDIGIPELDGWEATRILKADPVTAHIPIIAVTAHALPEDARRSMEVGCDAYLAKPISPTRMIAEVDGWLQPGDAPPRSW